MDQEEVKNWLKDEHRTRTWLAEACGVALKTVNNWLSSPQVIPAKAQVIIQNLMAIDRQKKIQREAVPQNLVLEFSQEEFDLICEAALKSNKKVRNWAESSLMELAGSEVPEVAQMLKVAEPATQYVFVKPTHRYQRNHTIRQPYSAAAGIGNDGDDMGEVPCYGDYPEDHFGIHIIGDSMDDGTSNSIPDGSLAVLKPMGSQPYAKKGQIYAWSTPEGNIIKRYNTKLIDKKRVKVLESLHPEFADVHVTEDMKPIGEFICVDQPENRVSHR